MDEDQPKKVSGLLNLSRRVLGEVIAATIMTFFAVYSGTLFSYDGGAAISAVMVFLAYASASFATGLIFSRYGTAHLAAWATISAIFGDENCKGRSKRQRSNGIMLLVTPGAWLLAAVIARYTLGAAGFDRSLGLNKPPVSLEDSFFTIFFLETLAKTVLCHIQLFSSSKFRGMWGALGSSLFLGLAVVVLGNVTGGSINFWRSVGVAVVEGETADLQLVAYGLSEIAAPVLAIVVKRVFFPTQKQE